MVRGRPARLRFASTISLECSDRFGPRRRHKEKFLLGWIAGALRSLTCARLGANAQPRLLAVAKVIRTQRAARSVTRIAQVALSQVASNPFLFNGVAAAMPPRNPGRATDYELTSPPNP